VALNLLTVTLPNIVTRHLNLSTYLLTATLLDNPVASHLSQSSYQRENLSY